MSTNPTKILIPEPSKEMKDFFSTRTDLHIALVSENLTLMQGYLNLSLDALNERGASHDKSKYDPPERISYIWISWWHRCKNEHIPFEYPKEAEDLISHGWQHHICSNRHHPEAHLDLNEMSDLDIVEMVCDWAAIAQEIKQNKGSCQQWAEENIDKKWTFSTEKKKLIFKTIAELDYRRGLIR